MKLIISTAAIFMVRQRTILNSVSCWLIGLSQHKFQNKPIVVRHGAQHSQKLSRNIDMSVTIIVGGGAILPNHIPACRSEFYLGQTSTQCFETGVDRYNFVCDILCFTIGLLLVVFKSSIIIISMEEALLVVEKSLLVSGFWEGGIENNDDWGVQHYCQSAFSFSFS